MHRDPETGEQIIAGLTQIHVEVIVERIKERFGAEIELHPPRVPYLETIRKPAKAHGRYKKQTGGRGQFGDCQIEIEPNEPGEGFEFVNAIKGGVIPGGFIPAVEKGVVEAMAGGVIAGYPMQGRAGCACYDGQHHIVDSSEMAFKIAGSMAFKQAVAEADAYLLEPIMQMTISVPEDAVGDVIGDLNSRRGRPLGMEPKGDRDRDQGRGADGRGARLRARPARDHRRARRLHDGVPALRGGPGPHRPEGDRRGASAGERAPRRQVAVGAGGVRDAAPSAAARSCAASGRREYVDPDGEQVGVCPLCKPRAEAAGWLPAGSQPRAPPAPPRRRRGAGATALRERLARARTRQELPAPEPPTGASRSSRSRTPEPPIGARGLQREPGGPQGRRADGARWASPGSACGRTTPAAARSITSSPGISPGIGGGCAGTTVKQVAKGNEISELPRRGPRLERDARPRTGRIARG